MNGMEFIKELDHPENVHANISVKLTVAEDDDKEYYTCV